jgi:predicted YcjX-like family ATPase
MKLFGIDLDRDLSSLFDRRIRLGVTGLSRSGKSVFVAALVHALTHPSRLGLLDVVAEERLRAAVLQPQPHVDLPRFAYEDAVARLTGADGSPPQWPPGTRNMAELRLSIRFAPRPGLLGSFGDGVLHLDIFDYPGEWLIDLPLLTTDYASWSAETLALAVRGRRAALSEPWRAMLSGLDPDGPAREADAIEAARLYTAYLAACRSLDMPLARLQPGRFLLPGDLEGSPALTFCPLPEPPGPRRGTLFALMEERFEGYKARVVRPFFRDHFARLDRQIVLVDLLAHLAAGPESLADFGRAMDEILGCFKVGGMNWLRPFETRIRRVLFAATKADHLPREGHDGLVRLLDEVLQASVTRTAFAGATVRSAAIASLRATTEVDVTRHGRTLRCVSGLIVPGGRPVAAFPGTLPRRIADATGGGGFGAQPFLPPPGLGGRSGGWPHIRLDTALEFLIGADLA